MSAMIRRRCRARRRRPGPRPTAGAAARTWRITVSACGASVASRATSPDITGSEATGLNSADWAGGAPR
jgi:hypothetical protein